MHGSITPVYVHHPLLRYFPAQAVVLSAVKAFLHLTLSMTATHQQVGGGGRAGLKGGGDRGDGNPSTLFMTPTHT